MKQVQDFTTKNPCYTSSRRISVKGLMLHSVGCPQPDPRVFRNTWDKASANVGVHYVLGSGECIQCLPDDRRAWHCGGSGNDLYLSFEMTEPATIRYTGGSSFVDNNQAESKNHVLAVYRNAVEIFASKCKQYGINPNTGILSHKEGNARGIASNHGDPDHLFRVYGFSMDGFRTDVSKIVNGNANTPTPETPPITGTHMYRVRRTWSDKASQIGAYRDLTNAVNMCNQHAGYSVYNENGVCMHSNVQVGTQSFVVKVTTSALNIRSGNGTNYKIVGCIRNMGVYTIVEKRGDWGRLKSGAGWIHLGYTRTI